ncbi:nicotinamide-nucleotide amidase [Pantoea sp. Aalb]|uniref:nicotinamide-nucleotide amidase n=1 Tax=Pantoea sp. Aalb TaxID=2576762 RepID=UPI00132BC93E|nr:nicotinamide-nucleotide amidase [Pantoea sp. Aalb]MXP67769.1 nicotinamide-nucleotide amidase [Pantoea sp. Aalb]
MLNYISKKNLKDKELKLLSQRIGEKLKYRYAKITTAESCTGGWIAKILTDINHSSTWFECGFITYNNISKQKFLGVQETSLRHYGSVSEQVVKEMVIGACKATAAEYGIAVSGIAGPTGGTLEKPVGTVWFAIAGPNNHILTYHNVFLGNRNRIRRSSVILSLQILYNKFLIN